MPDNTPHEDDEQELRKILEGADFIDEIEAIPALIKWRGAAVREAKIAEREISSQELHPLLKKNYEFGTGDLAGFNSGINAVLNANNNRIASLLVERDSDE